MPIKVLHNFASLNLGGAESRTMDIYRYLDRNEIQFEFVTYDEGPQYFEKEIEMLGGKVHRVTNPRSNIFKHIYDLDKLLKQGNFDVVHSHTSYHSGIVLALGRLRNIPIRIAHARTTGSLSTTGYLGKVSQYIGQFLIRRFANHKLAISKESGEYVFGSRENFRILANAFEIERFNSGRSKRDSRVSLDLPIEKRIVGQIGRFSRVKNHLFSVDLLSNLVHLDPNIYFVFVGIGPEMEQIRSEVVSRNLQDFVHFAGLQKNIPEWLASFDVFIMPSTYEGLGVAALEAQAAGLPVIASSGIPPIADLGLGLIKFVPLTELDTWIELTLSLSLNDNITSDEIMQAFSDKGFTLEIASRNLVTIYKNLE